MARPRAPAARRRCRAAAAAAATSLALGLALAQPAPTPPAAAGSVLRAEGRLAGRAVPDITLHLADGRTQRLSEVAGERPLLVTFFYRRCTGVCTPMLEWVRDVARDVGGLGRDYRILALSFDDSDTAADVRAQAEAIGVAASPDWAFAVAPRDAIERVTGVLDFWFRRDAASGQFDHPALLVALDHGRVLRAMLGGPGNEDRFRELVWELRGAFVASYRVPGQTALSCMSFDPRTGKSRLDWGLALLALPGVAAFGAALALFTGLRRRRQRP